jgi:hypothetical protein
LTAYNAYIVHQIINEKGFMTNVIRQACSTAGIKQETINEEKEKTTILTALEKEMAAPSTLLIGFHLLAKILKFFFFSWFCMVFFFLFIGVTDAKSQDITCNLVSTFSAPLGPLVFIYAVMILLYLLLFFREDIIVPTQINDKNPPICEVWLEGDNAPYFGLIESETKNSIILFRIEFEKELFMPSNMKSHALEIEIPRRSIKLIKKHYYLRTKSWKEQIGI